MNKIKGRIKDAFDFGIFDVLVDVSLFTPEEDKYLHSLHEKFLENISKLPSSAYNKEFERLAIDLSWKSCNQQLCFIRF